jgi:hypothetical protein
MSDPLVRTDRPGRCGASDRRPSRLDQGDPQDPQGCHRARVARVEPQCVFFFTATPSYASVSTRPRWPADRSWGRALPPKRWRPVKFYEMRERPSRFLPGKFALDTDAMLAFPPRLARYLGRVRADSRRSAWAKRDGGLPLRLAVARRIPWKRLFGLSATTPSVPVIALGPVHIQY